MTIAGHRTSVSLEQAFWDLLRQFAREDGLSINGLIAGIDAGRSGNLSSGLRVFVLQRLLAQAGSNSGAASAGGAAGDGPNRSGGVSRSGSTGAI